ncbi:MAG: phosphatase PAP2 family protein [Clostridia bacterium]|nr:phosphatase PAP2 family protein [Clostridia bacterium]
MKKKFIAAAVLAAVFVLFIILVKTVGVAVIGPNGTEVGFAGLNGAISGAFGYNGFFYKLTQILGYLSIVIALVFAEEGIEQLIKRKSLKAIDGEIIVTGVLYVLTAIVYLFFEIVKVNYRPVIMPGDTAPEASFPSSHTVLACVILVGAAVFCVRYLENKKLAKIFAIAFCVTAGVTVFGRILAGVHWFTDIIGGLIVSAALIVAYSAALDFVDSKKK